jgi:hypothetical protein
VLRHHLRRAAAAIAAANDEDLLRLSGDDDAAERRTARRWGSFARLPTPHEPADRAGHWHRGAHPASGAV